MKRIVGIDFTDVVIRTLHDRGFSSREVAHDAHGYRSYFFPLKDQSGQTDGFEIQVVIDDDLYVRERHLKHFYPFFRTIPSPESPDFRHENTTFEFLGLLNEKVEANRDLEVYLKLKKAFVPGAIVLRCRDWKRFCEVAKPDAFFNLRKHPNADSSGQDCGLIHLGLSCFDLIVLSEGEIPKGFVAP